MGLWGRERVHIAPTPPLKTHLCTSFELKSISNQTFFLYIPDESKPSRMGWIGHWKYPIRSDMALTGEERSFAWYFTRGLGEWSRVMGPK